MRYTSEVRDPAPPWRESRHIRMRHVFLIPGFFGFANFGDIQYFVHVREILSQAFTELGEPVEIHYVKTLPTASLPRRAAAVAQAIADVNPAAQAHLHLVGHSTGGLDARLFASPGVSLPTLHPVEEQASRVKSIISIATPHYGAPLATLFVSIAGEQFLRVLSILTLHGIRLGSMPLPALLALAGMLPRIGSFQGPVLSILDQVYRQLLQDFDETRQGEIEEFLSATQSDRSLLYQLAPESLPVFNAATTLRSTARHGSVITQARPPSLRATLRVGLSPSGQAIYSLYRALYQLAGGLPDSALPPLERAQSEALTRAYGSLPGTDANDAIVPTRSQVFGEIVHATWADHLDIIGHFHGPHLRPPHIDWLSTQSSFSHCAFGAMWKDIAAFMMSSES